MKIRTTLAIALALGATAGCKKKEEAKVNETPGTLKTREGTKPATGSAAAKPPEPAKVTPLTGEALAKMYVECTAQINAGNFDGFQKACLAADYKGHDMDGMEIPSGDAVIGFFKDMKKGFPDFKIEPQLVMVSGRNILGVALMTGTNTADWKTPDGKEMKKTDKKLGQLMFHRLTINDENKASEEWSYSDPMTMMGQLGLMPKGVPTRGAVDKGWPGAPIVLVSADDAKEQANLAVVKKGAELVNAKQLPDLMAQWTDDAVESDQAGDKDYKGKQAIEAGLKVFFTAFPDMKLEVPSMWAAGDYVVALGTMSGTHKGAMGPIKATNKEVKGHFAEVFKLKDGKVAELWRFRNGMAMAMQLGLMGPPPGDAAKPGDAKDMKGDMKGHGHDHDMKGHDMKGHDMKGVDATKKAAPPAKM